MLIFTKTDKALLDRAAKQFREAAEEKRRAYAEPSWAATDISKKEKKAYDRLLRDERDLRALAKRLEAEVPTISYPAGGTTTMLTADPAYSAPGARKDDGLHPGSALS